MLIKTRRIFTREKFPVLTSARSEVDSKKNFSIPIPSRTTVLQSVSVSAFILFCLINGCSLVGKRLYGERKYKSTENQIIAFNSSKRKPDIVLLGSSLFRTPLYVCNLQHGHASLYEEYCWDDMLQNLLIPNEKHSVLNFAIDGSLVSDVFLVQEKFLTNGNSPKWIIYGISPRDFLDNFVSKETRTPIFDRLFDLNDILFSDTIFKITMPEKLDLILEKLCWLYGSRSNVQQHLAKKIQRIIQGEAFQGQNKNITDTSFFQKESSSQNLRSYQKRYQVFSIEKFNKQKLFLKELCKQSIRNGTNVLLVNMPLTNKIANLIPQDAYSAYNQNLAQVAKLPGVTMFDLQGSKRFSGHLFGDLVHLNGQGGYFLELLMARKLLQVDSTKSATILKTSIAKKISDFSKKHACHVIDGISSWWLAKSYFAESKTPEIVILGDSQLWPVLGADACVYKKPVDVVMQHRSLVLEHDFQVLTKKNYHVFLGVTPKALISDQAAICHALFSDKQKPLLVALTISPLNFVDAESVAQDSTEASVFFSKYKNPGLLQKYLEQLRSIEYKRTKKYDYDSPFKSAFGFGEPFERLAPGENIICGFENYPCEDHASEYKKRYAKPLTTKFYSQMDCLKHLITWLVAKHIKVIVFSNPISASHRALLPEKLLKYYDTGISDICARTGADYINAERIVLPFNADECFDDVHLNLSGGLRWSRPLAVYSANKLKRGSFQQLVALTKYLK